MKDRKVLASSFFYFMNFVSYNIGNYPQQVEIKLRRKLSVKIVLKVWIRIPKMYYYQFLTKVFLKENFWRGKSLCKIYLLSCASHMLCAYFCLVLLMVISQDKMVGPSSWGTTHPVQTNTGVSSFVPHHAIQNSQYISGGM